MYLEMMQRYIVMLNLTKLIFERESTIFLEWTDKWQMKLNINKCKLISVHHRRYADKGVIPLYVMINTALEEVGYKIYSRYKCLLRLIIIIR